MGKDRGGQPESVSATDSNVVYESNWREDSDNTPVCAITMAVAELEGCEPVELPPLYDVIDPDSLNGLHTPDSAAGADRIVFPYCGYEIELRLRKQSLTIRIRSNS